MVAPPLLVAAAKPLPRPQFWDPRLIWAALALVGVILLGALIITWVDRWRRRPTPAGPNAAHQLTYFRSLYERGELNSDEFKIIENRLTARAMKQMNVTDPGATQAAPDATAKPPPDSTAPGGGSA
jgi:hypothetical protein